MMRSAGSPRARGLLPRPREVCACPPAPHIHHLAGDHVFTVLFADDSRNIREFCGRELEKEGYRVLLVSSGEAALETCREETPDIVVLDVRMPGMDGIETAGRIVRAGLGIPVIFYTAFKDRLATEMTSWAAVECVEKAEALTELKAVISRTLAAHAGAKRRSQKDERLHNDLDGRRNTP